MEIPGIAASTKSSYHSSVHDCDINGGRAPYPLTSGSAVDVHEIGAVHSVAHRTS